MPNKDPKSTLVILVSGGTQMAFKTPSTVQELDTQFENAMADETFIRIETCDADEVAYIYAADIILFSRRSFEKPSGLMIPDRGQPPTIRTN